jgi:transcriptional regulator with XRE-family HTH domain
MPQSVRGFKMKPEDAFRIVLRKTRLQKGLAQEKVALDGDLERTHVGLLERGQRKPTISTLFKVAKGLGVPASKLIRAVENEMLQKKKGLTTKKKK